MSKPETIGEFVERKLNRQHKKVMDAIADMGDLIEELHIKLDDPQFSVEEGLYQTYAQVGYALQDTLDGYKYVHGGIPA